MNSPSGSAAGAGAGVAVGADGQPVTPDTPGGGTETLDPGTSSGDTGSSGDDSGSTGGTGSSGGDGGSGGDSGSGPTGSGKTSADGGVKAGSCDGFKNGPGITDDTITIGNASDISGPVPGLFESAQDAVKAFVAYYNRSNPDGICGRTLVLKNYDSRTDDAADQRNHIDACENVFAMVGSMSAFDSGGAATTEECGLPDVRAITTTKQRTACTICYAAQPAGPEEFQNAAPDYIMRNHGGGQKAAMLYLEGGAATVESHPGGGTRVVVEWSS